MVTTLLVVLILSVIAVGVAWMASSEKKTSFAEAIHVQSVFAADAGTEAGINFLRLVDTPPVISGLDGIVMDIDPIALAETQTFEFECYYAGKSFRPGWGIEYPDYDYVIDATGRTSIRGTGYVKVMATRMFKEGY